MKNDYAEAFFNLCRDLFETWKIYEKLFSKSESGTIILKGRMPYFFEKFNNICQDQILLGISKLHDQAAQSKGICLTFDFIVNCIKWDTATKMELENLKNHLGQLAEKIKISRNKVLAHNDLKIIIAGSAVGNFEKGMDREYFENLQTFLNVMFEALDGGPRDLGTPVFKNDLDNFGEMMIADAKKFSEA